MRVPPDASGRGAHRLRGATPTPAGNPHMNADAIARRRADLSPIIDAARGGVAHFQ